MEALLAPLQKKCSRIVQNSQPTFFVTKAQQLVEPYLRSQYTEQISKDREIQTLESIRTSL